MADIMHRSGAPALAGDQYRTQPGKYSVEGRAIARSDRQAVVRARDIANGAALEDFTNELEHQLELNQIQRRARRVTDIIHAQSAILDIASNLARGDAVRGMEYADVYQVWKIVEMQRLAKGDR